MGKNSDGSAVCDRCGIWLEGYGVLFGLITSDLNSANGDIRSLIFCYENSCRSTVLADHVSFSGSDLTCSDCGVGLSSRSVFTALLANDVSPFDDDVSRTMSFCYINGSRDRLLAGNLGGTP